MANVLVVDDDTESASITKDMVSKLHTVYVATDPVRALNVAVRDRIDILVCDIRMPGMDGFQLIELIRRVRPNLPVIILSAYFDESDSIAYQMGKRHADAIYSKPCSPTLINTTIDDLLASMQFHPEYRPS